MPPKPKVVYDLQGLRVGPWLPFLTIREAVDPLPYPARFAACAWRVPPSRNEPTERFFWTAGCRNGACLSVEEGKRLADAALVEQGMVLTDVC